MGDRKADMSQTSIDEFKGPYAFLSNFYPSDIIHERAKYPTAEHLFQALKTNDPTAREQVRLAGTPRLAKRLGRKVALREDWNEAKDNVMRIVVEQKFLQNPDLKDRLVATGNAVLVEGNWWGDTYWGVSLRTGQGENKLGEILQEIRASLRAESAADI